LPNSGDHRLSHTVDRALQPTPDPDAATILVCDDDPSLRELVRAVLGPRYRFIEAADGTEALVAARELDPDLIVLDEPWEGLDPDASRWLTEAMRARRDAGVTILVSSHRLHDLAGVCDRYVFLDRGFATIVAGEALARNGVVTGDGLLAAFDAVRGRAR